jgi:DNA-binding transcriptional LysR family regulator
LIKLILKQNANAAAGAAMPTTLDIDALRALIAIDETKSFSRAAERLGRSQSAISLQIGRLEGLVGHAVIERARGRVVGLTARGEALAVHARQMVELNERAIASVRRPSGESIRIGMTADFLERDFAAAFESVRLRHPAARFEVRSDLSARLIQDLNDGRLDLAFFERASSTDAGSAIAYETLRWFRGVRTGLARRPASSSVPLVAFADGCAYREEAVRSLERAGRGWHLACEARTFDALVAAVAAGMGFAVLPAPLGERRALAVVPPPELPALNSVTLAMGIAEGRDNAVVRAVASLVARHCVAA